MGALKKEVLYCHAKPSFVNSIAFQTTASSSVRWAGRPDSKALSGVWEHEME